MTFNADDGSNRNEIYDVNTLTIGLVWKGPGWKTKAKRQQGELQDKSTMLSAKRPHDCMNTSIVASSPLSPHCECDHGLYYGWHAGNLQPPCPKHA
jgi:hypothetical protein